VIFSGDRDAKEGVLTRELPLMESAEEALGSSKATPAATRELRRFRHTMMRGNLVKVETQKGDEKWEEWRKRRSELGCIYVRWESDYIELYRVRGIQVVAGRPRPH